MCTGQSEGLSNEVPSFKLTMAGVKLTNQTKQNQTNHPVQEAASSSDGTRASALPGVRLLKKCQSLTAMLSEA